MKRLFVYVLFSMLLAPVLQGCSSSFGDGPATIFDIPDVSYYKNDELLSTAKIQFKEKNYGKAYALFKKSVEVFPEDPAAWLGYAASADMIGRFDNADTAYRRLSKLIPNRPEYHNNIGYSYLLRGKLVSARRHYLKAYEIDPSNETTVNNLEMLRNSVSFAKRG